MSQKGFSIIKCYKDQQQPQHTPVFDSEHHRPDVWLSLEAGKLEGELALANDDVRRLFLAQDGVTVDDLAVVGLNITTQRPE